jgi:sulfur relay (sulfurtransferase) complex TusBCD TusD component (DsrE family)
MKIHASALNITSELRKKWSLKFSIFFHENSCKCIEYHIWTKKKIIFESFFFFMKIHASALNITFELRNKWSLKVSIFFHENSCKCIEYHIWTKKKMIFESFFFFMKIHASAFNITSELRKKWSLKVSIFFHENSCKCIEYHIWTTKKIIFESFNIFSWKLMQVHWISHLN